MSVAPRSDLEQFAALVQAQASARRMRTDTAQAAARRAVRRVDDFFDPRQTRRMVTEVVAAVQTAQRATATTTDAYLARTTSLVTGRRVNPVGAVDVRSLRRQLPAAAVETLAHADTSVQGPGPRLSDAEAEVIEGLADQVRAVPYEQVYGRLADTARYLQVAEGYEHEAALEAAVERAEAMVDMDVALADRAQTNRFLTERKPARVIGYRRVLRPEIDAGRGSGQPPCGLCVVAADRLYKIEDLMPLHSRCRCGVCVVTSSADFGDRLNSQDLRDIYQAAGGTAAARLKRIRVETVEHGELGPVLVNADHAFRGPRETAQATTADPALRRETQLRARRQTLERLRAREAAGEDVARAIQWNEDKIRQLNGLVAA